MRSTCPGTLLVSHSFILSAQQRRAKSHKFLRLRYKIYFWTPFPQTASV